MLLIGGIAWLFGDLSWPLGGIAWLFGDLSWPLGGTLAALAIIPAIAGGRGLRK